MAWLLYIGIGTLAGLVAGLLGVGGGTVIVPALVVGAGFLGIDAARAPAVAVATSLAVVVPTSIASARAHARCGAVDWRAFARLAPGIALGAMAGAWISARLGGAAMMALFIAVALLACVQLLRAAPRPADGSAGAVAADAAPAVALPRLAALSGRGLAIGLVSALAGVGGGLLSVPLLAHYLPVRRAIGTAAALGLPLASAAMAGYALSALRLASSAPGSPSAASGSFGAVLLPAALALSAAAVVAAPLGARLAHRLPVQGLKRLYAVWLLLVCVELGARIVAG